MRENTEETIAIVRVLGDAAYMDLSPDCTQRRYSVARRLASEGTTGATMATLFEYAKKVGDRPEALFASWLRMPSATRKKIAEMMGNRQWVIETHRRLSEVELSGDPATIISLRDRRRSM